MGISEFHIISHIQYVKAFQQHSKRYMSRTPQAPFKFINAGRYIYGLKTMRLLNTDIDGAILVSAGKSFHDLTARMKNERRANSVRARGTSRWPSLVARVARTDALERLTIRERSSSAAFSLWMGLYNVHTCCRIRSLSDHILNRSPTKLLIAPEMRLRYLRPVTRQAPKLIHLCSLRFWITVQLPHTHMQQVLQMREHERLHFSVFRKTIIWRNADYERARSAKRVSTDIH